jgi:hypothetical protein
MRYIWMIFGVLLVAMLVIMPRLGHHVTAPAAKPVPVQQVAYSPAGLAPTGLATADSIVAFGLAQRGTPYVWAGTSPLTGFDCSGFIMYTFAHFGVAVPHSTTMLIDVGRPVARAEAQPGDIVVFTGTSPGSTTPGHAGIIITRRGELPVRFVHASSSRREPFVKVNQLENSDYERRFMQVRRVLGPGTGMGVSARTKAPVAVPAAAGRAATPVAALPSQPVAVAAQAAPVAPLPNVLPKLLVSRRVAPHKPVVVRKPVAKAPKARKAMAKMAAKKAVKALGKHASTKAKTTPAKKKRTTAR